MIIRPRKNGCNNYPKKAPPVKLTRRTLATIVTGIKNRQAALDNPQEFASQAARVIHEKAIQQLVDGIKYEKDGTWYEMTEWVEQEETISDRLAPVENSIYDQIVVQSDAERKFAEKLKKRKDVRLFVKLPGWFKVPTPVGQYNPDWALVMEEAEDAEALLYLVCETKSTTVADELRGTENQKIHCGERHFSGALNVDFRVVTSADDLP
jgi:type III restriction enzyme